ncbi:hypothetical protein ACSBQS_05740 [Serratia sp. H402Y]|uniref:hypothetical protein n=1 Tax=Serratia sp. H402Y TaxID=3444320 RepID=UPI003EC0D4D2
MVMVIKSNVPGATIANPDGWNPPFSTQGLRYANIFGRGNLSANLAPGGVAAVVHGNPSKVGEAFEFSTNNYIDTRVPTSETATLISIADISHKLGGRNFLITSFNGGNDAGKSLLIEGGSPAKIAVYAHYKGTDSNGNKFDGAYTSWFSEKDNSKLTAFLVARDFGNKLKVQDLTNSMQQEVNSSGDIRSFANPALTYLIGQSRKEGSTKHLNYASLIYDRTLDDAELRSIFEYFIGYYIRRGINIQPS